MRIPLKLPLLLFKLYAHPVEICFAECGRRLGIEENPCGLLLSPLALRHISP